MKITQGMKKYITRSYLCLQSVLVFASVFSTQCFVLFSSLVFLIIILVILRSRGFSVFVKNLQDFLQRAFHYFNSVSLLFLTQLACKPFQGL